MIGKEGFVLGRVGEKENQQRYKIAKFTNTLNLQTFFFFKKRPNIKYKERSEE
jgi:hypothetical protein